jgi:hypothetical protein
LLLFIVYVMAREEGGHVLVPFFLELCGQNEKFPEEGVLRSPDSSYSRTMV